MSVPVRVAAPADVAMLAVELPRNRLVLLIDPPRPAHSRQGRRRRSAWLQSVYVALGRRGEGVGSALLAAAARQARHQDRAYIEVHSSQRSAPLYERTGYRASPGLRDLWFDHELDEATDDTTGEAAR